MGSIVTAIFGTLSEVITSLTGALASAFDRLLWNGVADSSGTVVYSSSNGLSSIATFGFTVIGIGIATGLVYMIFRIFKRRA